MITLYGFGSPNVLKVVIALEELGLGYRLETVDVFRGEQFSEGFGALTPNRKVPVLVDPHGLDGRPVTLWESGAILCYLAQREGRFAGGSGHGRLAVTQWLMWQMAGVGPMFGQLSHFRRYAPQAEHAYARARYATEVKRLYDVAEARLAGSRYLAGEDYTIADMAAWPWLRGAQARGVRLAGLPAVARWVEDIGARPAVARALAAFEPMTGVDLGEEMRVNGDGVDRYVQRGRWSRPEM